MRRTGLKVLNVSVAVAGLAAGLAVWNIGGGVAKAAGEGEHYIDFDLSVDGSTFNFNRGISGDQLVRGDGFMQSGKIFPPGTLQPGTQKNDPNQPGSIGTWVARGASALNFAQLSPTQSAPGLYWTLYITLQDGMIIGEGWFAPSGLNDAAIVGGTKAYQGAQGEVSLIPIGFGAGGPNDRVQIHLVRTRR